MGETPKTSPECTQPLCSGGAVAFFEQHGESSFLSVCYDVAPAPLKAAMEAEIDFLRRALAGAGRVLEVGCGDGRLLEALADSGPRWVGFDLMPSYLRYGRAHRRLPAGAAFAAGRAGRLPFASASFDAVLCAQNTLGLFGEEKLAAVREAARVTRAGGRCCFVVYSEAAHLPRTEWYAELHRQGMMAAPDAARSTPELFVTSDGYASEAFRRERLEALFREAGLAPRLEPLGELYWAVTARV